MFNYLAGKRLHEANRELADETHPGTSAIWPSRRRRTSGGSANVLTDEREIDCRALLTQG